MSAAPSSITAVDGALAGRAADLAGRLPEPLAPLARIAYDYRWCWYPGGNEVFRAVDPARWERCGENPVRLLQETSGAALSRAASDRGLLARIGALERAFDEDLARPSRAAMTPERPVAFLCAEFGVHQSLPIYSGGLGGLAGDFLKEASDQALPAVAIGLLYRQGYFRQRLDASGWQHEYWIDTDPERLPAALVTSPDGQPITITVPIGESSVTAQIWRAAVGRVPLFLLDADRPENSLLDRWITSQLYVADPVTRLAQYVLLGVGGLRALKAMDIEPGLVHLNEGHAAFAVLQLALNAVARGSGGVAALDAARERTVFTTHTPVAAGNETYEPDLVTGMLRDVIAELGVDPETIIRLGRDHPDDDGEPFGVTQFSLRMSHAANAVSRRHEAVAREMWRGLWPQRALEAVPITHVTNGVHPASWVGPAMRRLLDRYLGEDWWQRAGDVATWERLDEMPDAELWEARRQRADLVAFVKERSGIDRLAERQPRKLIELAARGFDPDALTIGFARRNATYKRMGLLVHDPRRAIALLSGSVAVQFVLAGKAHPADDEAKGVVRDVIQTKDVRQVSEHAVYLHDYDLALAKLLVRGCDVWLNLPRPPLEASGTSGMKAMINGGLNLSVLDGWWAEAYDGSNGWALEGDVDPDPAAQDARDANALFDLLEREIVPSFYERDDDGVPHGWLERIRASMRTLAPVFCTARMLDEYVEHIYLPTMRAGHREADGRQP